MNTLWMMAGASWENVRETLGSFFSFAGKAFSEFGLFDAVDILFLTILFFLLFRFLNGRKAGALFIGIFICAVILLVSAVLNLRGTYYIFSSIFDIGVLLLVILFQPEIREALEKIGAGSLHSLRSISERKDKKQVFATAIEQICTAVSDLSSTKTGALIVIVRATKLDDIVKTGVPLNADVNSFLLRNIFFNKAPLHDGAVVVDEGRIAAAGCLLPLTRRTDIDSELGTRHRAAIGMSEMSDAVVVVVSEETGRISVADDCTLRRDFTPVTLREYLSKRILNFDPVDQRKS